MRFPQCEFPLITDADALEKVRAAVESGEAFSMIRLGDGEAIVMSVGDDMWFRDFGYLSTHWGADNVSLGDLRGVRDDLADAIAGADLVGIRNDIILSSVPDDLLRQSGKDIATYVRENLDLRPKEEEKLTEVAARRLALLTKVLSQFEWQEGQQFCSAWLHWELLATGTLNEILDGVTHVGLVTSKPELEHMVARRFGVRTKLVEVPEKFIEGGSTGTHVPSRYQTIREELDFPSGTLVLVGAGIPGKIYCQWIKEAGGIALDVGSVLDAWVGKASRPLVLQARFQVAGGRRVPSELRLREWGAPNGRRLVPRSKPSGLGK